MRTLLISTLLACAAPGFALAETPDPLLPTDSRIKLLTYDEADVYSIVTKYGYQTSIVLGPAEEIQTISVGDRSLWQIIPSGNRLFIRPMDEDVTTNMTVITNRHSYQFDLKSLGEGKGGNLYVAKFMYPEDRPKAPPMAAVAPPAASPPLPSVPPPVITQTPVSAAPVAVSSGPGLPYANYNYTYSGPDSLAPLQVYDDGKSTFIKYQNADQPPPAVYVMDATGARQSSSYYVKGEYIVVSQVAPEMALESNGGTLHIYNEMLNPR